MPQPKVDQSGYQLDKADLTKDLKFPVKGIVEGVIDAINKLDANHDGKADICQYAPYVIKALPVLIELAPLVEPSKFKAWLAGHDWVKDEQAALALLGKVESIAVDAAKIAGAK
jgi:hypothetical protein